MTLTDAIAQAGFLMGSAQWSGNAFIELTEAP